MDKCSLDAHSAWLGREVYGALSPAWRRYTGLPEYGFMVAKSYWPWLPFMIAALVAVIRSRQRQFFVLVIWIAVVLVMCAAARSRVLRYMLPAYPAFAILARDRAHETNSRAVSSGRGLAIIVTPLLAVGVLAIAIFPPNTHHAAEIPSYRDCRYGRHPGRRRNRSSTIPASRGMTKPIRCNGMAGELVFS